MSDMMAAEVQVLAAMADHNPMTIDELSRVVADEGMHPGSQNVAVAVRSLVTGGMAEPTPAASLGRFRITAKGRDWIGGSCPTRLAGRVVTAASAEPGFSRTCNWPADPPVHPPHASAISPAISPPAHQPELRTTSVLHALL
jgi:hypothetical protein